MMKNMKKNINTPKILIMSQRFLDTDWKYFRISPWASITFNSTSCILVSMRSTISSCSLTMWANCWNIPPNSTIVLSILCIVSALCWTYWSDSSYKSICCCWSCPFGRSGCEEEDEPKSILTWSSCSLNNKLPDGEVRRVDGGKVLVTGPWLN